MPLEAVQLLCSAHSALGVEAPYVTSKGHLNHPCAKWVRASLDNYKWLLKFGRILFNEYTFRYGKTHKAEATLAWCEANLPNIKSIGLTPHAMAMPEECKSDDVVASYRKYFVDYKWDSKVFVWKKRPMPEWYANGLPKSAKKTLGNKAKKTM